MQKRGKIAAVALVLTAGVTTASAPDSSVSAAAEQPSANGKHWVFLRDKQVGSVQNLEGALQLARRDLHPRALIRRSLRGAAKAGGAAVVTLRDLPVAESYVDRISATGAKVIIRSRWLNAVSVRGTNEELERVKRLDCVRATRPVARYRRKEPPPAPDAADQAEAAKGRAADPVFYGRSFEQLDQMNLPELHDQGYTGQGIVIGVLDTGFARWHEAFNHPGHELIVLAEWDFVNDDPNAGYDPADPVISHPFGPLYQHSHGTWILGLLAAYKPGKLVGAAYDAAYILAKTEDISSETPIEEDYYVAGLEFIEMHGADVATSSLGYSDWYDYSDMDGLTAVTTQAVNIATSNGLICCTASGNGGRDQDFPTLIAPSDAFEVISVGAVNAAGGLTDFSSAGPSADGRVKPEVLARGEAASTIADIATNGYEESLDGTSVATPLAAGSVACILEANPTWTVTQMRQNLFFTAQDYVVNGVPDPDFARGYGIVDAFAAAQDCNSNGVADLLDINASLLTDCNGNRLADLCEPGGDFDGNGFVDLGDAAEVLACLTGPCLNPPCSTPLYSDPCCALADFDDDRDVDLTDVAALGVEFDSPP